MKLYLADAFANKPFEGNPAGVCLLPAPADDAWMQCMASEVNAAETSFLYRERMGYALRWFTPEEEVDLCGHATLAAAHILWETGELKPDEQAVFYTKSGRLTAERQRDGSIQLNFPVEEDREVPAPEALLRALHAAVPKYVGRNRMDYIAELESEAVVRNLKPDLQALDSLDCRGLIVTAKSDTPEFDFVSRFFAPNAGIPEDPVTGSAHCCLGPYWMRRLGKSIFSAYQASKRGGRLAVEVAGDRVRIGGRAVTVFVIETRNL